MLVISIPPADLCLHQKNVKNGNGRAMFVIVVNVEPRLTAFMTGKIFRPRISLKIGLVGYGFQ